MTLQQILVQNKTDVYKRQAEFLYGRHRQFRNIGHGIQLERQRLGHRVFFSGPIVDGFAECADLFFFNGQARRSGMPAKAQQQRCTSAQSGVQVKAGGGAPTAAACLLYTSIHHHAGRYQIEHPPAGAEDAAQLQQLSLIHI